MALCRDIKSLIGDQREMAMALTPHGLIRRIALVDGL
jgi:hypothetical protein